MHRGYVFACGLLGTILTLAGTWPAVRAAGQAAPATHHIKAGDLPAPSAPVSNPPKVVPRPDGATLAVPPGFRVEIFAEGFPRPRWAVQAPNGDVFVSDSSAGSIYALHDANGNHAIDESERTEFATGLKQPFGMAFANGGLYVANTDSVVRFDYAPGQVRATAPATKVTDLPSGPTGHWTRNIRFTPDLTHFYVTVGSSSNVDPDPDPLRAAILLFRVDGSDRQVIATGIRNAIGFDLHPATHEPWMAVQERDGLGDDLVPDYVARVRKGAFYGWPYAYIGTHEEPRRKGERPDLVRKAVTPEVLIQAHSAIMGMAFYTATSFPEKYRGGAFAALRGSGSRSRRTGYKVVFLPFENGNATGTYEDFLVGWMLGEDRPEVWGRPVGIAMLADGSMLVTDDGAGRIWRVRYGG